MTFEASRKKQLLVLQPKGKPLYENDDTSSFGLKMLQNWGWKKGNGLGREQQGNKDFIQVRYRNNANGLGFDGLKDNQWTQNEANFDSLLKNLNSQSNSNSNSGDETEKKKAVKSLEEMSKQSRARVHYKKFTRGKDVYKYSEKDLANILGKKTLKEPEEKEVEVAKPVEDDKPDTYKSDLIINTGVSITEYFKQKMNEKKGNVKKRHRKDSQKFIEEDIEPEDVQQEPEVTENLENECNGNDLDNVQEVPESTEKSKKKKKNKFTGNDFDNVPEVPEVTEKPKKKKKKDECNGNDLDNVPEVPETTEKSKKKKKKNKCNGNDQEIEEIAPITENDASVNSDESNTKKRKKKKADLIEPVEEEQEVPAKKKKKSKVIEEELPTTEEVTSKKKKKKQAQDSAEPAIAAARF
ncbi:PIN2/TERF1-interacting telomerase inhibitor 1 isoform X2 [Chironomus tepperi]|uniref:PIN2/TERF1-interacting telomerase inhibitor 1 isoform X2 n=1 Tax=Chironomus tepperi TaxID=113505 RepID=UPI00391F0F4E